MLRSRSEANLQTRSDSGQLKVNLSALRHYVQMLTGCEKVYVRSRFSEFV